MFRYISLREQLIEERKKNTILKAQTDQNTANIDYIAMMSDIELDTVQEPADEPEIAGESEETEVDEDEQQV